MNGRVVQVDDVFTSFAETVEKAFQNRANADSFVIALSGGSSAVPAYEALSKKDIDWSLVTAIWGDERQVPLDHKDSNYLATKQALFDRVGPLRAIHPMIGNADEYDAIVRGLLPIDLVHLGMGPDGHTASLFPGSPALTAPTDKLVVETGDDLHPHRRLTLTFSALNQARLVVFTLSGEGKREMFSRIRAGEEGPSEMLPAGQVAAQEVVWLVDAAANGA